MQSIMYYVIIILYNIKYLVIFRNRYTKSYFLMILLIQKVENIEYLLFRRLVVVHRTLPTDNYSLFIDKFLEWTNLRN